MADNEVEDESVDVNETEGSEAKKSFLKSKLFLIIAGVTLLLFIAGGAYYFFVLSVDEDVESENTELSIDAIEEMSLDELMEEDETQVNENEIAALEDQSMGSAADPMATQMGFEESNSSESSDLAKARDDSSPEKEDIEATTNEDIDIQQQNEIMKQKISELEAKLSQVQQTNQGNNNTSTIEPLLNENSTLYPYDYARATTERKPNIPIPKPSWGEFERLNK